MSTKRKKISNIWIICSFSVALTLGVMSASSVLPDASAEDDFLTLQTQKHILENGLTVLINEMPASSMAATYILVKTGSATEGEYLGSGISHFAEHMLFKGTHSRGVGDIGKQVKALGGYINASTSFDYTIYVIDVPAEHVLKAVDIVTDMVMNASFDEEEVESERDVIYNEMRLHSDNPNRKLSELVLRTAYTRHPYQHPVIGYKDLLSRISREDLIKYYKTHYAPNNMVMGVSGNVNAKDVLDSIKEKFQDFPRQYYQPRNLPNEPDQIGFRYYEQEFPTDLTRLSMAYHSVSIMDEDLYALDILNTIMGQLRSSRLFQEIYEKRQLVHTISSSNYTPMDAGMFEIECTLERENVDKTIEAIKEQIKEIQTNGVSDEELEKVKHIALSRYIFGQQTAGQVNSQIVVNEAFTGDHGFSQKYLEGIRNVSQEDVQRVANQYLKDSNLSLVVLYPKGQGSSSDQAASEAPVKDIEKIVLDNGTILLLRENHTIPIIALNTAYYAGLAQEPEELAGLSEITARLWSRETKKYSPAEVADLIDSRGASLGAYSGRNTFGLSSSMLTQDFDDLFDLFMEIYQNPVFSQEEIKKEKEKMKADILVRDDQIFSLASQAMRQRLFKTHPFRRETLGTNESIDRITRKDIKQFYERYVAGEQMVISIFGDFDRDQVLEKIKNEIGRLNRNKIKILTHTDSPPTDFIDEVVRTKKEQTVVVFGFHGPSVKDEDVYPVQVLNSILGSSLSGRMFVKIRDELGQAYSLGAGAQPGLDMGYIYMYILTKEEHAQQVKATVKDIIRDVQKNSVTDEEIQSSKDYIIGGYERALESNSALGHTSALNELYGLGYDYHEEYPKRINAVSKADINRVVNKYYTLNSGVVVTALPQEKEDKE